jgi:exonuclease V
VAREDSPGLLRAAPVEPETDLAVEDTRSPVQRFRTKPKKPLSVTDLVSPAWCELQYWYYLTKFGRKKTTPAMKQGTAVHKILEEQNHEIVQVRPQTKEDVWGLKIWNVIQGLRTLRTTGMTRELEIWGVIDGQVVNGVIDEISYTCPDPVFEEKLEKSRAKAENAAKATPPPNQTSVADFLKPSDPSNRESGPRLGNPFPQRKVYVTDVKTRGSKYLPKGVSLRPTAMQLMLYRMLLDALATNTVMADVVFARYSLRPLEPFTSDFVEEIEDLDFGETASFDEGASEVSRDFYHELKTYNNLTALWSLMVSEFGLAMAGSNTISNVLQAEFRWSKTGEIIGKEVIAYDAAVLQKYVGEEMQWWKGEREAKGVDIEEAFKCRFCEFADECTWRKQKIEEALEKHRLRMASRAKSSV